MFTILLQSIETACISNCLARGSLTNLSGWMCLVTVLVIHLANLSFTSRIFCSGSVTFLPAFRGTKLSMSH